MKKRSLVLFVALYGLSFLTKAQINYTGFENFTDEEEFTKASWESEGFTLPWVNGFDQSRAHVDNAFARSGNKSLRIKYPANTFGTADNGALAPLMVTPADELYTSYWVRFSDNFDWGGSNEGGKLPGLGGGARCSGCKICTGSNGFTARLMWRTNGKAVLYLYHIEADKANAPCGDNIPLQLSGANFYFQKGQWYNIIERVKVNTASSHDGEVEIWIDAQPALLVTGIQFVNNGDKVNGLHFSTFHGGNSSGWSPSVDCHIWFDDIKIAAQASDVFLTTGVKDLNGGNILSNEINVYPNPVHANNQLKVDLPKNGMSVFQMEWFDIVGKRISNNSTFNNIESYIQVPDLPSGIYLLKLTLNEKAVFKKIVID